MRNLIRSLCLVALAISSGAHAEFQGGTKGKILIVASSPATAMNGWPVGFWMAEVTHPYDELTHAGYQVDIVSTGGGLVALDAYSDPRHESGYSAHDLVSLGFLLSPGTAPLLEDTRSIGDVTHDDYLAIVVAGGVAPMFTFRQNKTLQKLIASFYTSGKPTAALCHGVTSLLDVKLPSGEYLVTGKRVTAFSLAEDKEVEKSINDRFFDWYVEDALKARGANYVQDGLWADFAVQDGNLITGQQQYSGRSVARLVIEQLANQE
ncbi:MAG: type 1 glutamine amidotransferase domain-containing protein [Pseudomonadota bacterium]